MQSNLRPHFCEECSKIMIPMNVSDELYYVCRNPQCAYSTRIDQKSEFCVFSKNYTVIQQTSHQSEVSHDPTYPRVKMRCEMCRDMREFVYYYAEHWAFNCSLQIFYICTECGYQTQKGGDPIETKTEQ